MKEIPLSQGKVALVDDEDFEKLHGYPWFAQKSRNTFYAQCWIYIEGKRTHIIMHRLLMNLEDKNFVVDHRDGDGLNNQKYNMRVCTTQENNRNRHARRKDASSQYLGVYLHKHKPKWKGKEYPLNVGWVAQIKFSGKRLHLGRFKEETEAARAYDEAAKKHFGEFANLNFK